LNTNAKHKRVFSTKYANVLYRLGAEIEGIEDRILLSEDVGDDGLVGFCGVCCSHCGMQARIPKMARDLQRFVEAYRYGEWIGYVTQDFDFRTFLKGLGWFANSGCNGCLKGGGMPNCEVRNCCKEKGLGNCYSCEDFLKCTKLAYQKETYKIEENFRRIKQIGYGQWLKDQVLKSKEGFDNIHLLEKK